MILARASPRNPAVKGLLEIIIKWNDSDGSNSGGADYILLPKVVMVLRSSNDVSFEVVNLSHTIARSSFRIP